MRMCFYNPRSLTLAKESFCISVATGVFMSPLWMAIWQQVPESGAWNTTNDGRGRHLLRFYGKHS